MKGQSFVTYTMEDFNFVWVCMYMCMHGECIYTHVLCYVNDDFTLTVLFFECFNVVEYCQ